MIIPILAIIGFFSTIVTWIYMRYKSQHQQRMALIDSGKTADIFIEQKLDNKSSALKYGMLLTGIGVGFFIGVIVEQSLNWPDALGVVPLSAIGGGLGLIGFYLTLSRKEEY